MARQNINIGITANDKTGDPLRTAFTKTNANFTELYTNVTSISNDMNTPINYVDILNAPTDISDLTDTTGILIPDPPSSLVNTNKQVSLDTKGTLIVPNSTDSYAFQMVLSTANYVPTQIKPTLPLLGSPWSFNVQIAYANSGINELVIVSGSLPSATNPGYSSGDTFTFSTAVHGIPNYTLTITLTDVTHVGFIVWNATLTPSSLPAYPSTLKSLGPIKITANTSNWTFGSDGNLYYPDGSFSNTAFTGQATSAETLVNQNNATITAGPTLGTQHIWNFGADGALELPVPTNIDLNTPSIKFGGATSVSTNDYGFSVPGPVAGVVYNATTLNLASMKLLITIEGLEDAGDGLNHTQVCEMLVVRREGLTSSVVDSVVYGVIHTSLAPLATLTTQQSVDGRVEILALPTNTTPIYVKVHATEVRRGD